MRIARKKETVDDANFVNTVTRTQGATEGLMNPFANSVNLDAGGLSSLHPIINQCESKDLSSSTYFNATQRSVHLSLHAFSCYTKSINHSSGRQFGHNLYSIFTSTKLRRIEGARERN